MKKMSLNAEWNVEIVDWNLSLGSHATYILPKHYFSSTKF